MKKTLLFDLDGTLTDPKEGILGSLRYALKGMGWTELPEDKDIFWCIGPPIRKSFQILLKTEEEEVIEKATSLYRQRYNECGKFENYVFDQIPETLREFQQKGHRLLVATSKPEIFANQIVDKFDLRQYFDAVYGVDLEGKLDKKPELLAHLLRTEELQPDNCIMIGDREHDVIAAKENGVDCCGITWGYGSEKELRDAGAKWICEHPSQLLTCLPL